MLSGAVIGLIVGLISALVIAQQRSGALKKLTAALASGDQRVARAYIDKEWRAVEKVSANQTLKQMDRAAALAVAGDVVALKAEDERHDGGLVVLAQVRSVALIGIAVRTDGEERRAAVQKLDDMVAAVQAGRAFKAFKTRMAAFSALGHALLGEPLRAEHQGVLHQAAGEKSLQGLLMAHVLAVALRATGITAKADELDAKVRGITSAFADSRF